MGHTTVPCQDFIIYLFVYSFGFSFKSCFCGSFQGQRAEMRDHGDGSGCVMWKPQESIKRKKKRSVSKSSFIVLIEVAHSLGLL